MTPHAGLHAVKLAKAASPVSAFSRPALPDANPANNETSGRCCRLRPKPRRGLVGVSPADAVAIAARRSSLARPRCWRVICRRGARRRVGLLFEGAGRRTAVLRPIEGTDRISHIYELEAAHSSARGVSDPPFDPVENSGERNPRGFPMKALPGDDPLRGLLVASRADLVTAIACQIL